MRRVILYGVRHVELRRDIEYFLDDAYEIIGYSDSYYTSDVLDGKRFIRPEQLSNTEFDYIIPLSFKEPTLTDMEANLKAWGCLPQKIVRPTMFLHQGSEKMQVDLIADIEAQYQGEKGLIFGLSYSLRGILKKKLRPVFYDCSWHGLDLYYNYRIFQYMWGRGLLSEVRIAFLVFPYYLFNYDMSRAMYHYRTGQMFALRGLDDWHNYQQLAGASDYIENYRMFGRKISDFYHFYRYEHQNRGIYQGGDGEANLDGLWFQSHPDTISENKMLYSNFCRELTEKGIFPILIIPPYYLRGLNRLSIEAFENMKVEFYQIAKTIDVHTFDYSGIFADKRELFADLTHLNSDGAEIFTRILNEEVLHCRKGLDL